jgi:hypothetical protein
MRRKLLLFGLLFVALSIVAACGGFTKNAYRSLGVSYGSYHLVLTGMGDLYKEHLIGKDVKDKAIEYGRTWKEAHNMAVDALALYEQVRTDPNKQTAEAKLAAASEAMARLLAYCRPYLVKYGKEVPQ